MKILSVTAALPIPDVFENENDVTLKFFGHLKADDPEVSVDHLYPALCAPKFMERFKSDWGMYNRIFEKKGFVHDGMRVQMCPYYCLRRFGWSRALTSHSLVWLNRKLETEMNIGEYDVIHAQKIFPAGMLACHLARRFKKPLVFSVRREMDLWDHWYSRGLARKLLRQASGIVSINYKMNELLVEDGFDSQFVPHGLDDFFFDEYERTTPQNPVRILSLCRLMKLKHLDKVLLAMKNLREKGFDFLYTIAGTGEDEARLKSLTHELGLEDIVEFMGRVEYMDVPQVMKDHDLFVMPSYPEIMGRVYFEAMAQGVPILGANESGIDGFFENWKSGVSVNHADLQELEGALQTLISDPELRRIMGQKGRSLVQPFSWDSIVKKYQKVYEDALQKSNRVDGRLQRSSIS